MTHINCLSLSWWNVHDCIISMKYGFLSNLPLFLGYKCKVAVSAGSAGDSCFPYLSTYPCWWCLWSPNSVSPGTVCTYICRNNVYVAQNRHSLKAAHLKVKLIEPIFSTQLLTLLMCTLNRRSQIWNQSRRGRSREMAIFRAGKVLPTQLKLLKRQSWRRCNHVSQRWWHRKRKACDKAME